MIDKFIKYTQQIFPSIDPYTAEEAQESIRAYIRGRGYLDLVKSAPDDEPLLAQGDVIGPLTFAFISPEGELRDYEAGGLLLSNTCDAVRDASLVFCPCIPEQEYLKYAGEAVNIEAVRQNIVTKILYIPTGRTNWVADLSRCNGFSRELLSKLVQGERTRKLETLNRFGYFFFLQKLSVHFMRPEDGPFNEARASA